MDNNAALGGHDLLAVQRYADAARHMIVYDVLKTGSPYGEEGAQMRLFLSDEGYAQVQAVEQKGQIKIRQHAAVIEGHVLPDKRGRKKRKKVRAHAQED